MDRELRALEREARAGEPAALEALLQARLRAGLATPAQQLLSAGPLPPCWFEPLVHAGLELLLAADLELTRAAARAFGSTLGDLTPLEALLAACDEALASWSSARPAGAEGGGLCADDEEVPATSQPPRRRKRTELEKRIAALRRCRPREREPWLLVELASATARGLVSLVLGHRSGAGTHGIAATHYAHELLGHEVSRELARRGALLQTLRGDTPLRELQLEGELTADAIRARLAAGTLRLADVGLAALAGHAGARAALPEKLLPLTPGPLEDWLGRLASDWGPRASARAWLALAEGLGLDMNRVHDLEQVLASGDDDRVEAALAGLEPERGSDAHAIELAGLALAALLADDAEALLPRVMARLRATRAKQADLRATVERALAAWALEPGTRFPGLGVAWTVAGDRSRARSAGFREHVLGMSGEADPGLATPTQLARIYAGMVTAELDVKGLLDLVAQAGAPRPEALKREFARWVLDQLKARRPAKPRRRARRAGPPAG